MFYKPSVLASNRRTNVRFSDSTGPQRGFRNGKRANATGAQATVHADGRRYKCSASQRVASFSTIMSTVVSFRFVSFRCMQCTVPPLRSVYY